MSIDGRGSSESVRHTVHLIKHILHILSSLSCLVHSKLTGLEATLSASAGAGAGGVAATRRMQGGRRGQGRGDGDGDGDGEVSEDAPSVANGAGNTNTNTSAAAAAAAAVTPGSPPSDISSDVMWGGSEVACDANGEGCPGVGGGGQVGAGNVKDAQRTLAGVMRIHLRAIERSRIAVNCLRILVQAEMGVWEGGYTHGGGGADHGDVGEGGTGAGGAGLGEGMGDGGKRLFSRATSMSVAALLHQALGVVVFINCKSGLDRTGLQCATQSCLSSLWSLYPDQRSPSSLIPHPQTLTQPFGLPSSLISDPQSLFRISRANSP